MPASAWTKGSLGAGSTLWQGQQSMQGAQEYASLEQPFPWITSKLLPYFCCFKYVPATCGRCPLFLGLGATKLHFETNVNLWTFTSKFSYFQIPSPSRRLYVGSSRTEACSQLPSSSHTGRRSVPAATITQLVPVRTACTYCLYPPTVKEQMHHQRFIK